VTLTYSDFSADLVPGSVVATVFNPDGSVAGACGLQHSDDGGFEQWQYEQNADGSSTLTRDDGSSVDFDSSTDPQFSHSGGASPEVTFGGGEGPEVSVGIDPRPEAHEAARRFAS